MAQVFWHALSFEEVEKIQKTSLEKGLDDKEVSFRQREFGKNEIQEKKPPTKLEIFLNQFKSLFIVILLLAGVAISFFGEIIDALAIFLVVLFNAAIGFFQEYKASKIFESLKKILKIEAKVIRNGTEKIVDAKELVPGDIVILEAGDKVPADGRIFEAKNLMINESILTGEFLPSLKHTLALDKDTLLADRENMAYMGTLVEVGKGKMIVTETGKNTEVGKISKEIEEIQKLTPLQKKIRQLSVLIAALVSVFVFVVFLIGILRGLPFFLSLQTSIALAVSAIPEGLPIVITVILALGAQKILKKGGLIKNLASIETLGSASVILTDKTLTLTEGKMEVAEILGEKKEVLKGAVATINAFVENPQDPIEKWIVRGRPIERAVLIEAAKEGIKKEKVAENKIFELPFDSQRKFSLAVLKEKEKFLIFLCGAPERLLEYSKEKKEWEKKIEKLAQKGLRIVGVAKKEVLSFEDFEKELKEKNFDFLGLIAFKDPLKKGAKEAFQVAKKAGIFPVIVSGDHKLTVKATAKELGLEVKEDEILEGGELDQMRDEKLSEILPKIKIFARLEPRHKTRICKLWQKREKIVAVTGDGVNDAPALKTADIGVAVGSGTEVAKEASDLVLLKDNFKVIKEAILEGRRVLDNARKATLFMCAECFREIILVFGAFLLKLPLPILPIQILWKNFIEGSVQGMAFSFEPPEKGIVERGPEDPKTPILTREIKYLILFGGILTDLILLSFFVLLFKFFELPIETLRTFCFAAIALSSFFYAFSCKNFRKNIWEYNPFSNKVLNFSVIFAFLVLLAAIYLPPFQILLRTVPLGLLEWSFLIILGILSLIFFEATKYFLKK